MTTKELLNLLADTYQPPTYAFIPEVRASTGWARESRADGLAMSLWPSAKDGLELTGFELKASRSDWLREMKDPGKATPIKQFCDRWYLVVTDASIVKDMDELPLDWGFIFPLRPGHIENPTDKTILKVYKHAPKLTPQPIDHLLFAALMRRADTRTKVVPK